MIMMQTMCTVADNSGARKVRCFKVLGGSVRRYASLGDICVCAVQDVLPNTAIKKGEVVKAVVVRIKKKKDAKMAPISGLMRMPYVFWMLMASPEVRVFSGLWQESSGLRIFLK